MSKARSLLGRLMLGKLSSVDRNLLNQKIDDPGNRKKVKADLIKYYQAESENSEEAFELFNDALGGKEANNKTKLVVSGIFAVLVAVFGFLILSTNSNTKLVEIVNDEGIVITTSAGEKINIEESISLKANNSFFDKIIGKESGKTSLNTLYVPKGKTFSMELEDGTIVHLNSDTELEFPLSFLNSNERKVRLKGEAYFEVSKNKSKPFIVESLETRVRVYGTSFNISNYESSIRSEIVLVEGEVGVFNINEESEVVLKPDQLYSLDRDDGKYEVSLIDVNEKISWREGYIVFNGISLSEAKNEIERIFNVSVIMLNEDSKSKKFSGKIRTKSIEELLAIFNATGTVTCEYYANEKKLIIK